MTTKAVAVTVECKDCGKTGSFTLNVSDTNDWGWIIVDNIKGVGFEMSETNMYCTDCAGKYKRGVFNSIVDKA